MTRRHLAAALLCLSFCLSLLPGCGRDKGSATPQAAQELAELRAEQELNFDPEADGELRAELAELFSRFDKTADVKLASSPHRITLLHLACIYKKTELARCLLVDGAAPNAHQLSESPTALMAEEAEGLPVAPPLLPADTPLTWAVIPHHEEATAEEMIPLIDLLIENGADIDLPGAFGAPPLVASTFIPSPAGEAVLLHLLERNARCTDFTPPESAGASIPLTALVAANGWNRALEKLLDSGASMATPARSALHAAAEHPEQPGALECARMLLARGAQVDALNDEGATPLYIAAHSLASPDAQSPELVEPTSAMLALLLQQGADPLRSCDADPEFPGSCPADFIAMNPAVQEKLQAAGVTVARRPVNFEAEGTRLLVELCRASLFGATSEEIAPHFGKLASLLLMPTEEQYHAPLYPDALGHTVKLLSRVDAARTAELVANLPLWQEEEAWQEGDARISALREALLNTPELVLPREKVLEHARRMDALGLCEVAAELVEFLERDAEAGATIESVCADTSLAIRAGALTARLLRAGLPAPRNGAVAWWMEERNIDAASAPAVLRRALLLTSLDKFWYGDMTADEVRALLEAMRGIGAPQAAAFYADLAANLDNPEELERLTSPDGVASTARFELECATALFLWSQKDKLLKLGTPHAAH